MSQYKDVAVGSTVYFWFAANTTAGASGDGATPLYDVRLAGASASGAPTASGTPTLLTHANYTDGLHEIAIDTTGYAVGEYAVFCTLTISTVNPAGFCGSFVVRAAASTLYEIATNIQSRIPAALVSGRIDASVGAYPGNTAQTGDNFGRLGAPVGASMSADIAAAQADLDNIQTRIPAALVSGRMDSSTGAMASNVMTAAALATDAVTEIQSGLATAAALTVVDDFLDTEVTAIKAKTDLIPAAPAAVGDVPTAIQNADAYLDRANAIETGVTPRQSDRLQLAAAAGKLSGAATATVTIRNAAADTTNRIVATVDADGNRSAVTLDTT